MTKEQAQLADLPDTPGVYFFLNDLKKILYIGKATSLRNRIKSYFGHSIHETRSLIIKNMVIEATMIDFTPTDSVLEALILETNLIRSHKPKFNTKSKDDKSYNHLIITNEEWPRVLVVRGNDITEKFTNKEIKYQFGPFPSGALLREALKIIRKIFRFYDTKEPLGTERSKLVRGRIDFNRQIGLYPETTSPVEYKKAIRHLRLFFEGKKQLIIKELEKQMLQAAKHEAFEVATALKKKIIALKHIEDISLLRHNYETKHDATVVRIEAYDVAHLAGSHMVGVMTVVVAGEPQKHEYRKFKIKSVSGANDPAALREILERRLAHAEWPLPKIIVVDGNEIQMNVAKELILKSGYTIAVVAVVKDDRHQASRLIGSQELLNTYKLEILHANAEAHRFAISYYRAKSRKAALPR